MNSSFQHLFDSNQPPSRQEVQEIRISLVQPRQEIDELDRQIASLSATLNQLTTRRATLNEYVHSHSLLILPLRQLPPELLSRIFLSCLLSSREGDWPHAWTGSSSMPFTQVCRRWREIALSTPELWSRIQVQVYRDQQEDYPADAICRGVESWLRRSGTHPLSVAVRALEYGRSMTSYIDVARRVIETMMAFSRRWSELDLTVPHSVLTVLNGLGEGDTPLLRRLSYNAIDRHQSDVMQSIQLFRSSNQLVSFSLWGCHLQGWTPSTPWLNLRQLMIVRSGSVTPWHAVAMLQQCPGLRICHLTLGSRSAAPLGPLKLGHLEELQVETVSNIDLPTFFDALNLPSLRELTIEESRRSPGPTQPSDRIACTSMIIRSACPLESLTLRLKPQVTDMAMVGCLQHTPSLKRLSISTAGEQTADNETSILHDSVIQALTIQPNPSPVLCPRLDAIGLFDYVCTTGGPLLRFLESRGLNAPPGIAHLQSASVTFARELSTELKEQFLGMTKEWPKLSLKYRYCDSLDNQKYREVSRKLTKYS